MGALRTSVTHGTISSPAGISNRTTRAITATDEKGRVRWQETRVYSGGYHTVSWARNAYENDRLARTETSRGELTTYEWGCCSPEVTVDSRGIETEVIERDALERVIEEVRAGVHTHYVYDAESRVLETRRSDGGATALMITQVYDLAGRLVESTDEQGLTTAYDYDNGGRTTTVTLPGDFVEITNRYRDGQVASTTGNAVVASFAKYEANADGSLSTTAYLGADES
jgi:YD repeat-containing protein